MYAKGIAIKYEKSFTNRSIKVLNFSPFGAINEFASMSPKIAACMNTASLPPANLFVVPSKKYPNAFGKNLPSLVLLPLPRVAINLFLNSGIATFLPNKCAFAFPSVPDARFAVIHNLSSALSKA